MARKKRILGQFFTKESNWLKRQICDFIKNTGNSVVYDPFAGSGTTLLAAKNAGLNYVGIEMSEKYVSIINERLKNI